MKKNVLMTLLFVLFVSLMLATIGTHYIKMSYDFEFDETSKYEDLFFISDHNQYDIYGIGSYDIYADRLIEKELSKISDEVPHSDTKERYEKKHIEIYPEFLIENRNEILSKCSFKKLSFGKSFLLSFLFNYLNNVTTIRIHEGYLSSELNDKRFSIDILQDFLDKGNGVINAGVFCLSKKTYLMTDYVFFSGTDADDYNYENDTTIKKCVFEILPSEETEELVEIKHSSQASFGDSYKSVPIGVWSIVIIIAMLLLSKSISISKKQKQNNQGDGTKPLKKSK